MSFGTLMVQPACPHHFICKDAAEFVLMEKKQPLQTNHLIGFQLESETKEGTTIIQQTSNNKVTPYGVLVVIATTSCPMPSLPSMEL